MTIARILLALLVVAAAAPTPAEEPLWWNAPRPEPEAPDRGGLLERIRTEAKRVRHASDCGAHAHEHAFLEALLYRASCEGEDCDGDRAEDAMRHLRRARAFQRCEASGDLAASCMRRCERIGAQARFHWLEQPSQAWAWIRNAPPITDEDRSVARKLLAEGARRSFPPVDFGTSNRSLVAAVGLLRTAQLVPDAEGNEDWRGYARRVWQHFRTVTDTEEDAASYLAKVWWPGLLQLAALLDAEDELWRDGRFVRLVERTFATTAPVGAMPAFGDSSSWGVNAPGLVWLFEEAGARLQDGRYTWLAERILRFQAARLGSPRSGRDPWARKMHHLAFAWLASGKAPPATPPEPLHYAVTRVARPEGGVLRAAGPARVGLRLRHDASDLALLSFFPAEKTAAVPASWRLWRWRGDPTSTTREAPLASGFLVALRDGGDGADRLVAAPRIQTEPGSLYYLEIRSEDPLAFREADAEEDASAAPWINGEARPEGRLAFEMRSTRGEGSVVTTRREVRVRPRIRWGRPPQAYAFGEETVADKLVLRSGFDPEDLFALVNLVAGYRHGHEAPSAFAGILDGGSVLVSETAYPYFEAKPGPEDENAALVRVGGRPLVGRGPRGARVEGFVDTPNLTRALLRHEIPGGRTQERHVLFVKNRFLWVRDRLEVPPGGDGVVHWHVGWGRKMGGARFDIATPGLLDNVWPVRNPARLARLQFVSARALQAQVDKDQRLALPSGCPHPAAAAGRVPARCRAGPAVVVSQRGTTQDGVLWLDSILVPHAPGESPSITVHARDGEAVALEVTVTDERWLLTHAPGGRRLEAPDAAVEATLAVHALRPGSPDYLHLEAARSYRRGDLHLSFDSPATLEVGSFAPLRPMPGAPR